MGVFLADLFFVDLSLVGLGFVRLFVVGLLCVDRFFVDPVFGDLFVEAHFLVGFVFRDLCLRWWFRCGPCRC